MNGKSRQRPRCRWYGQKQENGRRREAAESDFEGKPFQGWQNSNWWAQFAELPTQSAKPPTNRKTCFESQDFGRIWVKRCCYAGHSKFERDQTQDKTQGKARLQCASFSRFGGVVAKNCAVSKRTEDLHARRSGNKCDVHSKRRRKAVRCQ